MHTGSYAPSRCRRCRRVRSFRAEGTSVEGRCLTIDTRRGTSPAFSLSCSSDAPHRTYDDSLDAMREVDGAALRQAVRRLPRLAECIVDGPDVRGVASGVPTGRLPVQRLAGCACRTLENPALESDSSGAAAAIREAATAGGERGGMVHSAAAGAAVHHRQRLVGGHTQV